MKICHPARGHRVIGAVACMLAALPPLPEGLSAQAPPGPREACERQGLPADVYRRLVTRQFSRLVGQKAATNIGTFAAVDVKEAEASLAAARVLSSGDIVSLSVTGGATEGVTALLGGGKVSGSLGVTAQYHRLADDTTSLQFVTESCDRYRRSVERVHREFAADSLAVYDSLVVDLHRLEVDRLNQKIRALENAIPDPLPPPTSVLDAARADSLRAELRKARGDSAALARETFPGLAGQWMILQREREARLTALVDSIEVTGIAVGWWSAEAGFENTSFTLFQPEAPTDSLLKAMSEPALSAGLHYQWFSLSAESSETRFVRVGATGGIGHNLADLQKMEYVQARAVASDSIRRTLEERRPVYTGDFRDGAWFLRLESDFYQFLFRSGGIHVFPSIEFRKEQDAAMNLGFGYVVTAIDATTTASRLNAEIFVEAADLGNARASGKSFVERSTLGLRLAFPFTLSTGG